MAENISENKKLNITEEMSSSQRKYLDRLIRELEEIAGGRNKEEIFASKDLNLINLYVEKIKEIRKFLADGKREGGETLDEVKERLITWGKKLPNGYDLDGSDGGEYWDDGSRFADSEEEKWSNWLEDYFDFSDFPRIKFRNNVCLLDWLDIDYLPEDVEFEKLVIRNCHRLKRIPFSLKARKLIIDQCSSLEVIEDGIEVTDSLSVYESHRLTSIPGSIKAREIIIKKCENFEKLEEGVNPVDILHLEDLPNIVSLPKSFKKTERLQLYGLDSFISIGDVEVTNLLGLSNLPQTTVFPPNIKNLLTLDVINVPISSLPNDLCVEEFLALVNTQITRIPAATKKLKNLILTGSPVQELPDDLYVWESLRINATDIVELPPGVGDVSELEIANTKIIDLPDDFNVESLDISDTSIRSLPPMNKLKRLKAANTELEHLPDFTSLQSLEISSANIKVLQEARFLTNEGKIKRLELL